jgi:glutaredoxin
MTVEIYGTSTCNWCDRAQELCAQYDLSYVYKSLDDRFEGEKNLREFRERLPNAKQVPQIFWNDKYIGGFNELVSEIENTRNFGQEKI